MTILDTAVPATPVSIANGGTGATSAAAARTALGLAIGTDVQAYDADLATLASSITAAGLALVDDANAAAQRVTLGLTELAIATVGSGLDLTGGVLTSTVSGGITDTLNRPNTGLSILDTNASHALTLAPGSDLTAPRTLTLTTGDADRVLTLTGNATLNQDVSSTGSPTFAALTLSSPLAVAQGGSGAATLTNHGVLLGQGTSALVALAAAAAGTLLGGVAASDPAFTATPTLGIAGSVLGSLALAGNTSGVVTLRPAAAAGTWTLTLPTTDGAAGDVLATDGSGVTTWVAPRVVETLADAATVTPQLGTTGRPYLGLVGELSQATLIEDPDGTFADGQVLELRLRSTTARALTWGTAYTGSAGLALPTTTTGGGARDYALFAYVAATTTWDLLAVIAGIG